MSHQNKNREASARGDQLQSAFAIQSIHDSCSIYLSDCERDHQSQLHEYVRQVDPDAQPMLLRNLLHLELQRRRSLGETPDSRQFVETMPEHASVIRSVFAESAFLVLSDPQRTHTRDGSESNPKLIQTPASMLLGHYRLIRELGRGGMGLVFEAQHLQRGHRVALKTLPAVDGYSLHSFKQEFRRMAEINHPHLIGLHTLEEDHGHWFFTMDLIEGTDFLSYVRPQGTLDESRLRDALAQLTSAVLRLHGESLIHRDLKPSNVMVTHGGDVIVLDFGLVYQQSGSPDKSVQHTAGTPAYMAPEQAVESSVTGAADWYALGVMLYESLAGRRPFSGESSVELLLKKTRDPAPPLNLTTDRLRDLAQLANELLHRDPASRPDAMEIASQLCPQTESVASTTRTRADSVLVGRNLQLSKLHDAFDQVRRDHQPTIIFVSGRSGEGKTALVVHFLDDLAERDLPFVRLAGRCYDRESVPFKALDSLVDALASYLRRLPDGDAALMMPDDITFLANLFPVLRRVDVVNKLTEKHPTHLDQQQVRKRAFAALRSLLKRVTTQSPVVLFSDDLQWGDADSAEALYEVLKPPDAPAVLFIGSFRAEEADTSPFLEKWHELADDELESDSQTVSVAPLTIDECVQLAIATIGQDSESLRNMATDFARQTGGNALLLTELLSCYDPESSSFQVMPIHEVINSKLRRLPREASNLLEAIAVSGQSLQLEEVALAAGVGGTASSVVTHMRSEKLVRLIGDEELSSVDTYHDKIRETVLTYLSESRKTDLHRALAHTILDAVTTAPTPSTSEEQTAFADSPATADYRIDQVAPALADRAFDLSYHFDAAGDSQQAFSYALLAADRAARQFSQRVAADQLAIARRNAPAEDNDIQFRIAKGEGRALSLLGDYEEAWQSLDGAVSLTSDPLDQARVLGLMAEVAHKQGKIGDGIELYSEALRKLGHYVPRTLPMVIASLGREVMVQLLHTVFPTRWYQSQKILEPREELAVELANRNSIVSYYNNLPRMIWTHLKGLNLAEKRQPSLQLAYACGLHPAPVSAVGLSARGLRYNDEAIRIAEGSSDLLTQGHCYAMRSMALYAGGHHKQTIEAAKKSIDLLQRAGDPYLIYIATTHKSLCQTRLGHVKDAISGMATGFERSVRLGENVSLAGTLFGWSLATDGALPFAELRACFDIDENDHFSNILADVGEGVWHQRHGRLTESIEVLERMWSRALRQLVVVPYAVGGLGRLITVTRCLAETLPEEKKPFRRKLLRRAWSHMRAMRVLSRMYPCERPCALRELGLLLALSGRNRRALSQLRASIRLAGQHGDVQQHAISSCECGRMEKRLGDPRGAERMKAAKTTLDRMNQEIESHQHAR